MSLDKMSATVRSRIVSRLKEVITGGASEAITERKLKSFLEYTSRDQIRKDTDTVGGRHESIMSRGAFSRLLEDMDAAIKAGELSRELDVAVKSASFDGFIAYISEIYYKDKEFLLTDNRRVKNGFIYSGPTRNTTKSVAVYAKEQGFDNSEKDVLLLKNIEQGKLVSYYAEYIASNCSGITEDAKKKLKSSLQGGHLTGVFTARLIRAFGLRRDVAGQVGFSVNQTNLSDLERQLASIVDLVTDADFLSSNITTDIKLFTETDKRLFSNAAEVRLTTEVQFAKTNKEAGQLLTTAGTYLTKLIASIKPTVSNTGQEESAQLAFKKMLENLNKVSIYVKDRAEQLQKLDKTTKLDPVLLDKITKILQNQKTFDTLLNTEGSPSIVKHIENIVVANLTGKSVKTSRSTLKTNDKARSAPPISNVKPKAPSKTKRRPLKFKEPALKQRPAGSLTTNIVQLQNLINQNLAAQIRQNMGTGNSTTVLNYRTGRFAESAKVERMLESREGMITAFYSYMRNPYGTFAEGGRQEFPTSRNPKTLIAKSIRELAGTQVANRMRAVLV
jgi:hypothetical protein